MTDLNLKDRFGAKYHYTLICGMCMSVYKPKYVKTVGIIYATSTAKDAVSTFSEAGGELYTTIPL